VGDEGGSQLKPQPAFPLVFTPGAREPGMLTTFDKSAQNAWPQNEPETMGAVTTAERQREGGGAPGQRRLAGERSPWKLTRALHQFLLASRALYTRRFRTGHV
jgi:hypothetical protein